MAKHHIWNQTEWWHYDAYRLGDGDTHIVPASNEPIRYNPMDRWQKGWTNKKRKEWQPPYIELARLNLDDPWDIAGWCSKNGLLGILTHRTEAAVFWPRWGPARGRGGSQDILFPLFRRDDFPKVPEPASPSGYGNGEPGAKVTEVPPDILFDESDVGPWASPHAIVNEFDGAMPTKSSLFEAIGQFFPDLPGVVEYFQASNEIPPSSSSGGFVIRCSERERLGRQLETEMEVQDFPMPFTEEYLVRYAEPIELFKQYAENIKRRVEMWHILSEGAKMGVTLEELLADRKKNLRYEFEAFVACLSTASPIPDLKRTPWACGWRIPSLYATLHVMMLLDYCSTGKYARFCKNKNCRTPFFASNARKMYCSQRCIRNQTMRDYRDRKSEAEVSEG